MAQSVEQLIRNQQAAGSSPASSSRKKHLHLQVLFLFEREEFVMAHKQNLHTHSVFCDGKDTLEEMVIAAIEKGFDSIGFSSHSYMEQIAEFSMKEENVPAYRAEVMRLRETYKDRIAIFCGLEKDYNTQMDVSGYDYLIGSVHVMERDGKFMYVDWDTDKLKYSIENVFGGDGLAYARYYFGEVAKIPDSGPVDILGHFDLLSKFCEQVSYFDVHSQEYLSAARDAIDTLEDRIPFFEVNTGAMARGYRSTPYPAADMVGHFRKRGFGAVITTDCHNRNLLDYGYDAAKALLIANGYTHHYVLTRDGFVPVSLFD